MNLSTFRKYLKSLKIQKLDTIIALIWAIYLIIHTLLAGKIWLWNLLSFIPPFTFLTGSVLLITANLIRKNIAGLVICLISTPLAFLNTDINLNFLHKPSNNKQPARNASPARSDAGEQVTIFNWNTEFWETDGKEQLYNFLKSQNADIYHLQEHYNYEEDRINKYFLKDAEELEENFPNFYIIAKDEFLTLSRYPIIDSFADEEGTYLRTEININDNIISFYNVHIPLQLYYPHVTNPLELLADTRTRFYIREEKFDILEEEIGNIQTPHYISGDFNTTKSMGKMNFLLSKTTDSFSTTNTITIFPTTWKRCGLKLWRIDYNLASTEIQILSHENINPEGFSDHWGQKVVIGI